MWKIIQSTGGQGRGQPQGCRGQGSPGHQKEPGSRAPRAGPEGWGDAGHWHPAPTRRLTCRAAETPVSLALSPPPTRAAPLGLGGAAGRCAGWRCARTKRSLPSRTRSAPSMPSPRARALPARTFRPEINGPAATGSPARRGRGGRAPAPPPERVQPDPEDCAAAYTWS